MEIFSYCERTVDAFWGEPLNALTNLAFALAAVAIIRRCRLQKNCHWEVWLLVLLAASIAVGSFLWHTLVTPWAMWADIVPIGLFINVFIVSFLARIVRLSWWGVVLGFCMYQLLNYAAVAFLPAGFLNGSAYYLPTLLALVAMTTFSCQNDRQICRTLLLMTGLFSIALLLRTLDNSLCGRFPIGVHFAWHLLNAWVLYLAMHLLVRYRIDG